MERRDIDLSLDKQNMYKEEMYTDMKSGNIRVMIPIDEHGNIDTERKPKYIGMTQLISQHGPIPLNKEIESDSLDDAINKFPSVMKEAMEDFIKRSQDKAREQMEQQHNKIIKPPSGMKVK